MKKLIIALCFCASILSAAVLPETSYDCEVSDTSTNNAFYWNLIRGESRYLTINYMQYGTNMNLTGATNGMLYLKASDSTNRYSLAGTISTTGYVRVLWPFTSAVPVAVYSAEFGCAQSNEVNLAARGKIKVVNGTGSGVATTVPWYVVYTETDPIWIAAKTGVDAAILQASNRITSVSNEVDAIQSGTSAWNQAVLDGTNWQQSVAKLIVGADTQYWNQAGLDGTNWQASVAKLILSADTSRWNTAGLEATWSSNGVVSASNAAAQAQATANVASNWGNHASAGYAEKASPNIFTGSNNFENAVYMTDGIYYGTDTSTNHVYIAMDRGRLFAKTYGQLSSRVDWKSGHLSTHDQLVSVDWQNKRLGINVTGGNVTLDWGIGELSGLQWRVVSNAIATTDIVNYQTATNLLRVWGTAWSNLAVQAQASATWGSNSIVAVSGLVVTAQADATWASNGVATLPDTTNYLRNAANQTNVIFSWGGMLDRYPTGAADNAYLSSAMPYAGTITNARTYVDSGTLIGDILVHYWSNRTYTVAYTGISWTVEASNFPVSISYSALDTIGFRITNGVGTNGYGALDCKR